MIKWYRLFNSSREAFERVPEKKLIRINTPVRSVCITRIAETFYLFENSCPHSGASLCDGALNHKNEVICPLHSYGFELQNGIEIQNRTRDLMIFKTRQDEEGLHIGVW